MSATGGDLAGARAHESTLRAAVGDTAPPVMTRKRPLPDGHSAQRQRAGARAPLDATEGVVSSPCDGDPNTPLNHQRNRIVAERLFDWCAQRDDSGHTKALAQTVRSQAYALCEMDDQGGNGADRVLLCSDAFCGVTGYARKEILGRSIAMLHGARTSQDSATHIQSVLMQRGAATTVQMVSYTRTGQAFWNLIHIVPAPLTANPGRRLSFVLLTNVSEYLLCGNIGQFPIGLDFLSESTSSVTRSLLGASLICQAEHDTLSARFEICTERPLDASLRRLGSIKSLSVCVANPLVDQCPITFASDAYFAHTGCDMHEVIGHSCCLVEGLPTEPEMAAELLRANAEDDEAVSARILCYTGAGEQGIYEALLLPLLNSDGELVRIVVVVQTELDGKSGPDGPNVHDVVKWLKCAEEVEGSPAQFFLKMR